MIDISSAISTILTLTGKLPKGHCLELLTYKKDRSISIVKKFDEKLLVIQKGYEQQRFEISADKLRKLVKKLLKKEFPRSNKAHISSGPYSGDDMAG